MRTRLFGAIFAALALWAVPVALAQVGVQNPTAGGNYTPSQNILGNTSGLANAAGMVGEEIESSIAVGSAVSATSATPLNVTSIALTPGNWLCNASASTAPAGGTTTSVFQASLNTVSATQATAPNDGSGFTDDAAVAAGVTSQHPLGARIYRVSANTTVYLVAQATFAVSTMGLYGYVGCVRIP